jgi:hypothetical protein
MEEEYNIYCDESCHLENDNQNAMVLGAIWGPLSSTREVAKSIRAIKIKHGLKANFEIKWTKVSQAKIGFYLELVRFLFDCDGLHFRALIIPDKRKLQHEKYNQDHDTWYYKMYFEMLKWIIQPGNVYRIFLDIKDTRSAIKVVNLQDVLANNIRDFNRETVPIIQIVRSHEVEQVQLADLLIGAIAYKNRELIESQAKLSMIRMIEGCSGQELDCASPLEKRKFNLFKWTPDWGRNV